MKIVVNARLLRKNSMDGIGWFSYNTLQHIVTENPKVEFHFLFDSGIEPEFLFSSNVVPHNLFPPAKHALLNIIWFEFSVKKILNSIEPDLFFSPDGLLCLGWNGKQYGVMHDLNYYHRPQDLKWSNNKYYNYFFPKFAQKACRIGTVSNYSKEDIATSYKIDPGKIDVLYNGINNFFQPLSGEEKHSTRLKLTGGEHYYVFIGTLHPRKNIVRLLQAFDAFKQVSNASMKLIIAGKNMYKVSEIQGQHRQMKWKEDVLFLGRIPDNEINSILASAMGLVFVPTFEGFGIPIIEAMQCDIPVICSNNTSMPEVAGDAAILVNPFSIDEIKDAMLKLYADVNLRNELIEKGRVRRNFFSWKKTSNQLWESLKKCL